MTVSIQCPLCKLQCSNIIAHLRYGHKRTQDNLTEIIFTELERVHIRIDSLVELLEIREK
jgi:hypothetical protein